MTLGVLDKVPRIKKLWADGGYQGQKLASALKKLGRRPDLEIVKNPRILKGFTVIYRRWVVKRDLRLDVALPTSDEGLRAELGELAGWA